MSMSAIQNYTSAARLAKTGGIIDSTVSEQSQTSSNASFKDEFSGVTKLIDGLKKTGSATEISISQQIMGNGSVEQTAMAMTELTTKLEIVSQVLRVGIEKIDQLTRQSMGG